MNIDMNETELKGTLLNQLYFLITKVYFLTSNKCNRTAFDWMQVHSVQGNALYKS